MHGSVNWGRVVEDVGISRRSGEPVPPDQRLIDMSISNSFAITGRYHLCGIDMRPNPDDGVVLYPALSIPVENKDTFSCPSGHVTVLERLLPTVTKMITIGWRGMEKDFLNMLLASRKVIISGIPKPVELLVVTGSKEGAEQTAKNLGDYGVQNVQNPDRSRVTTGFTGLINNLETLGTFLRKGLY